MRRAAASGALAAVAYAALALWSLRAVLPAPSVLLPYSIEVEKNGILLLDRADQAFSVRAIADTAHRIASAPSTLLEGGQCYPMPSSYTLGEHVLGEGLLGAVPWALSRDPIVTFNAVALASLLLPAVAMYALAYAWTGSAVGAFVAGLLFAFHPGRLAVVSKPFLAGNGWTPLVLLFTHRLFARGRWRDAALLVVASGLQLLASFYQVLGAAILAGTFAIGLAIAQRGRLAPLAPKLAAAAAIAAIALAVYAPYLEARAAWGTLQGRLPVFFYVRHFFAPHGPAYPGTLALALAALGLADRARRARPAARPPRGVARGAAAPGPDPRLPLAVAGLVAMWCLSTGIPIPGLDAAIPSPLALAAGIVPGLDAVRALPLARFAWYAAVTALAAYGVRLAIALAPRRVRSGIAVAIAALALLEVAWPPAAALSFLEKPIIRAAPARPSQPEIALYRSVVAGAVLDLPLRPHPGTPPGALAAVPALRAAAWHLQPIAACYNSFATPVLQDVEAIAERWPSPDAAQSLAALGFRSVLVHADSLAPEQGERIERWRAQGGEASRIGAEDALALYVLPADVPVAADAAALGPPSPGDAEAPVEDVREARRLAPAGGGPDRGSLVVLLRNAAGVTYRHPDPIAPVAVRVRWRGADGRVALESRERMLLPLALAPDEVAARSLEAALPRERGVYDVDVALESEPLRVVARGRVRVG